MKPPPNTCPQIDKLSVNFDALAGDLETFRDDYLALNNTPDHGEVMEIMQQTIEGLQHLRANLEDLRSANEALRECGKYWYQMAKGVTQ